MCQPRVSIVGMPTKRWLTDEEQQAWRAYIAMQHSLSRHLHRHLQREFGLSDSDFEILVTLSEARDMRMRAYELGEATQWEKSRLSHHLTRMEQRGLVCRELGEGRYPTVVLTDTGLATLKSSAPANARRVRELFIDVIGADRLAVLREIADDVVAAVDEHQRSDCDLTR